MTTPDRTLRDLSTEIATRALNLDLAGEGFHVIRVTWRQIVREPEPTLVRLSQALARRGTPLPARPP